MSRRLLNLLMALSLLACAAVVALWVRSYGVEDVVGHRFGSETGRWRWVKLKSIDGRFLVEVVKPERYDGLCAAPWAGPEVLPAKWSRRSRPLPRAPGGSVSDPLWPLPFSARWKRFGLMWCWETMEPGYGGRVISVSTLVVPAPVVLAVVAAPPGVWLVRRLVRFGRAWGRRRSGRCRRCGYDLRATPGRCPECGTVASAEPAP